MTEAAQLEAVANRVAISVAEPPFALVLLFRRALFLVDAVVCLENRANRSLRPRSRSPGIRGLVLSREPGVKTPCHSDQIRTKKREGRSRDASCRVSSSRF